MISTRLCLRLRERPFLVIGFLAFLLLSIFAYFSLPSSSPPYSVTKDVKSSSGTLVEYGSLFTFFKKISHVCKTEQQVNEDDDSLVPVSNVQDLLYIRIQKSGSTTLRYILVRFL